MQSNRCAFQITREVTHQLSIKLEGDLLGRLMVRFVTLCPDRNERTREEKSRQITCSNKLRTCFRRSVKSETFTAWIFGMGIVLPLYARISVDCET